tara:strand:- start:552 stop:941 length:390 start_codon:yes stop_codon:yes gene_type:complete
MLEARLAPPDWAPGVGVGTELPPEPEPLPVKGVGLGVRNIVAVGRISVGRIWRMGVEVAKSDLPAVAKGLAVGLLVVGEECVVGSGVVMLRERCVMGLFGAVVSEHQRSSRVLVQQHQGHQCQKGGQDA